MSLPELNEGMNVFGAFHKVGRTAFGIHGLLHVSGESWPTPKLGSSILFGVKALWENGIWPGWIVMAGKIFCGGDWLLAVDNCLSGGILAAVCANLMLGLFQKLCREYGIALLFLKT
jgi:hypothetical protein